MKFNQVMRDFSYRISGGGEFLWNCYPNARYIDFETNNADGAMIFDVSNQFVYEVQIFDKRNNLAFRWIHPNYEPRYREEAQRRKVNSDEAIEGIKWNFCQMENFMMEKVRELFSTSIVA